MIRFFKGNAIIALLITGLVMTGGVAYAQDSSDDDATTTTEALQQQVQALQEKVQDLQERLEAQTGPRESEDEEDTDDAEVERQIDRELERGDRGSDVRKLQEMLASNKDIYPEGLATGYYGQLTASAVARLQQRMGLPSVGEVNSETLNRVNELLNEGAGNSGVTPPGLLTAPGIQRALSDDTATTTEEGVEDDDEEERSSCGPSVDVENLPVPEKVKEKLRKTFTSVRDKCEEDDESDEQEDEEDDELEIEAEAEDGETVVEVEYTDETEEGFTFSTADESEVVTMLVEQTDLTESEIAAVIEFEIEDDSEEGDDDEEEDKEGEGNDDEDDDDDEVTATSAQS